MFGGLFSSTSKSQDQFYAELSKKTANAATDTEERAVDYSHFPSLLSLNTKTGVMVTPKSSLTLSTVFACVDLIASTISIIPMNVLRHQDGGRYPATDHDQYFLLKKEPCRMHSRVQWTKLMIVHYLLWGDGISIIKRNKFSRPMAYSIVMPWDVWDIEIIENTNGVEELWYNIKGKTYNQDDIIHFSDLSIDGKRGCGRISQNKEAVGLGIGLRDFGNDLIGKGGRIMGYVHGEKKMTPDAYKMLAEKFINGYGNEYGVGVLPHGWKYEAFKYPMPAKDAELLASREFSVEEICTAFRTHPFLIGKSANVNNSVAENIFRSFLMTTIAPITTMMEMEWDRKAFRESERNELYTKYNLFALDKADIEKTMNALVQAVNNGLMNKDEARDTLDRNPIPDGLGQDFYQPLNMAPLKDVVDYFKKEKIGSDE